MIVIHEYIVTVAPRDPQWSACLTRKQIVRAYSAEDAIVQVQLAICGEVPKRDVIDVAPAPAVRDTVPAPPPAPPLAEQDAIEVTFDDLLLEDHLHPSITD